MRKIILIPSWLFTLAMLPFLPSSHKWHGRYFTLNDWTNGATDLCVNLSAFMWIAALIIVYFIGLIFV